MSRSRSPRTRTASTDRRGQRPYCTSRGKSCTSPHMKPRTCMGDSPRTATLWHCERKVLYQSPHGATFCAVLLVIDRDRSFYEGVDYRDRNAAGARRRSPQPEPANAAESFGQCSARRRLERCGTLIAPGAPKDCPCQRCEVPGAVQVMKCGVCDLKVCAECVHPEAPFMCRTCGSSWPDNDPDSDTVSYY